MQVRFFFWGPFFVGPFREPPGNRHFNVARMMRATLPMGKRAKIGKLKKNIEPKCGDLGRFVSGFCANLAGRDDEDSGWRQREPPHDLQDNGPFDDRVTAYEFNNFVLWPEDQKWNCGISFVSSYNVFESSYSSKWFEERKVLDVWNNRVIVLE